MRESFAALACLVTSYIMLKYVLPAPGWVARFQKKVAIRFEAHRRHVRVHRDPRWHPRHA